MSKEEEEKLRYIGYSMAKKKWLLISPTAIREDTFEFINSGATAFVYANKSSNRIVKIIRGSAYKTEKDFINECLKEITYQQNAAKYGLAPRVYHHGFVDKTNSPFYDYELPYYYVIMDYLSEDSGWNQIFADNDPPLFCEYINNLVDKVGLINIKDPYAHFFTNGKKLMMIDYGNCIECAGTASTKKECKESMAKTLGIQCSFIDRGIGSGSGGGSGTKKTKSFAHRNRSKFRNKKTMKKKKRNNKTTRGVKRKRS
jgi:hypothetical protein